MKLNVKSTVVLPVLAAVIFTAPYAEAGIFGCKDKMKKNTENITTERPWGTFTVIDKGTGYLVKTITVKPGQKLSVQRHNHRCEHWIVLEGQAKVLRGESEIILHSGEYIDIDKREIHSLQNDTKNDLKILEVQKGEIISEDDIERLQDIYGRK